MRGGGDRGGRSFDDHGRGDHRGGRSGFDHGGSRGRGGHDHGGGDRGRGGRFGAGGHHTTERGNWDRNRDRHDQRGGADRRGDRRGGFEIRDRREAPVRGEVTDHKPAAPRGIGTGGGGEIHHHHQDQKTALERSPRPREKYYVFYGSSFNVSLPVRDYNETMRRYSRLHMVPEFSILHASWFNSFPPTNWSHFGTKIQEDQNTPVTIPLLMNPVVIDCDNEIRPVQDHDNQSILEPVDGMSSISSPPSPPRLLRQTFFLCLHSRRLQFSASSHIKHFSRNFQF